MSLECEACLCKEVDIVVVFTQTEPGLVVMLHCPQCLSETEVAHYERMSGEPTDHY